MTAVREANQVGSLQPTTLVSYEAEIEGLVDCRHDLALKAEGMDAAALADSTWRDQMRLKGEATTQTFARRLIASGHPGLLVRSFAPGAAADDLNMVLWKWGDRAPVPPGLDRRRASACRDLAVGLLPVRCKIGFDFGKLPALCSHFVGEANTPPSREL